MRLTRTLEVHRHILLPWLALAAIALLGVVPSHSQVRKDEPATGNVSGTVLNSVTHEPVGRALVYSQDGRFATFTDEHGHFEFSGVGPTPMPGQPNSYNTPMLVAKKPGFLSDSFSMRYGSEVFFNSQQEITLSLVPEALIVGRVKFPNAETADHVEVALYRREVRNGFGQWTELTRTETRSDGDFRFAGLRAGAYEVFTLESQDQDPLTAVPNGPFFVYPPRYFAAASDFSTADTIQLRPGETFTANIALESQRYFEVKVPVTGLDPTVPEGLEVSVHAQGHRGPGFELGYDTSLGAIIGSLPNGNYTLEASGFGRNAVTGIVNITVANRPVTGPVLAVTPNTSIEVNFRQDLTGADTDRQSGSSVSQHRPEDTDVMLISAEEVSIQRGAGGTFLSQDTPPLVAGVQPGRYWVQIQSRTNDGYPAYLTSGSRDLLRVPLIVPYGASVPPIEVTMRYDTGSIEIAVDPSAKQGANTAPTNASSIVSSQTAAFPPDRLSIYCIPMNNPSFPPQEPRGFGRGQFTVFSLPPGDYVVVAFDTRQEFEYRNPAAMRAYESKGKVVHVSPGQKTQVRIQAIESE